MGEGVFLKFLTKSRHGFNIKPKMKSREYEMEIIQLFQN